MSAAFTDHLADHLAANGLGVVGQSIFQGELPAETEGLQIVDTGGGRGDRVFRFRRVTVQVTARFASPALAKARIWQVYNLVGTIDHPRQIGNITKTAILEGQAIQAPFSLGKDERQRWRYVVNIEFLLAY